MSDYTAPASSSLQPETVSFKSAIAAAGGTIQPDRLTAHDVFISTGKREGWWSKMREVFTFQGGTLASNLVKLIGVTPNLVNNGCVLGDFSDSVGVTVASNKWLSTGFNPTLNSLSSNNLAIGAYAPSLGSGFAPTFGLCPALDRSFSIQNGSNFVKSPSGGSPTSDQGDSGIGMSIISSTSAGIYQCYEGVRMLDNAALTDIPLNANVEMFHGGQSGNEYFTSGSISGGFIAAGLSITECQQVAAAFGKLMVQLGRKKEDRPLLVAYGDSITHGQGATNYTTCFARSVTNLLGCRIINAGVSSSYLTRRGITDYQDVVKLAPQYVTIVYGTNDMNDGSVSTSLYQTNLSTVIAAFKAAGSRVVVGSAPYNTISSDATRATWAALAKAAADANSVPFVDLNAAMLNQPTPANFQADNTHPNQAGHDVIAGQLIAAFRGQRVGIFKLTSGAATIPQTAVTLRSNITLTLQTASGTRVGIPDIVPTPGTGFTATGGSLDTSYYNYILTEATP